MSRLPRIAAAAAVVALVALTTACGPEDAPPVMSTSSPAPPSTSVVPSQSPTSSTRTPTDTDAQGAVEAVSAYLKMIDQLAADPTASLDPLATVARDQALAQAQRTLVEYRVRHWKQVGFTTIELPAPMAKGGGAYSVSVCVNVSQVSLIDQAGKSVISPDRPDRRRYTYDVQAAAEAFFVNTDSQEGQPC